MMPSLNETEKKPRSARVLVLLLSTAAALAVIFTSLGLWQVQRLGWKLELIERSEARIHAEPGPLPPPEDWAGTTSERDEYRRIRVTGAFSHDHEVAVQAVTEKGGGFWILTPLDLPSGDSLLINRGFVEPALRESSSRPESLTPGQVEITGLLRMTEPEGAFLRKNDPEAGRWYSRDVAAIGESEGLERLAPWFLDAESGEVPKGGLTVTSFRNNHLVYALTWFALALGSVMAAVFLLRFERALRKAG